MLRPVSEGSRARAALKGRPRAARRAEVVLKQWVLRRAIPWPCDPSAALAADPPVGVDGVSLIGPSTRASFGLWVRGTFTKAGVPHWVAVQCVVARLGSLRPASCSAPGGLAACLGELDAPPPPCSTFDPDAGTRWVQGTFGEALSQRLVEVRCAAASVCVCVRRRV